MNDKAIVLFTRFPRSGHTKTRMLSHLNPDECRQLHLAFLKDIAHVCSEFDADIYVASADEGSFEEQEELHALFDSDTDFFCQSGEGLGMRMTTAVDRTLEMGYSSVLILGSDVPEIGIHHLKTAFELLAQSDLVLGPAHDGGYYLIGLSESHPEVFDLSQYGHELVFEQTVELAQRAKLEQSTAEHLFDIDTFDDLLSLYQRLSNADERTAPTTRVFLAELELFKRNT